MKALILAAGKGTRLKPLTESRPKPMIPVGGRPLLERIVVQLREAGITDLFINLHSYPESIQNHFGDGQRFGVRITYSYEPTLLGTAGAAKKLESSLKDGPFLVYYADNYVEVDLTHMISVHSEKKSMAIIAVFPGQEISASGVVEVDPHDRIQRFLEKPAPHETESRLVNAGLYLLEPDILDSIPESEVYDFGHQLFPKILEQGVPLYAYHLTGAVFGIDTPLVLSKLGSYLAQRDVA